MTKVKTCKINSLKQKFYDVSKLSFHFYKIFNKEDGVYFAYLAKCSCNKKIVYLNFDGTKFDGNIEMILNIW